MPLDPAAQSLLGLLNSPDIPPLHELPVPQARAAYEQMAGLAGEAAPVARTKDLSADGVPVRLYWPEGDGPHPVLIWLHGGGWVLGSAAAAEPQARDLCSRAGSLVVSVDYRRAPENRFPAAVDDVITVAKWVVAAIDGHGGDRARLAVGGDSAGANLAAVLANELPGTFAAQVLIYPATDLTLSHPSIEKNGEVTSSPRTSSPTAPASIWATPIPAIPRPRPCSPTKSRSRPLHPPSSSPPSTTPCATRVLRTPHDSRQPASQWTTATTTG